jgi:uncharacterized protein (TIGR03435 family)
MRRTVGTAALFAILVGSFPAVAMAQDAGDQAPRPGMMARDADPDWEVATVKPSAPSDTGVHRVRLQGRHVMLLGDSVEELLSLGYGVQKNQITGLPDWAQTQRWDVDGIPDATGEPSLRQIQAMMRRILNERFGLTLHHEQRVLRVYALTVAKNGAKLPKSTGDPTGSPHDDGGSANGRVSKRFTNTAMPDLILTLLFYTDRPVVDQTGIKGRYDFKLQWTTNEAQTSAPDAPPGLFTAIQEQLGLKLEPVKAPTDVLVIDAVQKPGPN